MNRNRYRLVFNATLGMMVPAAETARRQGKSGAGKGASGSALALAGVLLAGPSWGGELPVASVNFAAPGFTANYHASGNQAYLNQVGSKAVVNFQSMNISAGHDLQLRQVTQLPAGFNDPAALVNGANFSTLALIHDLNPSIIAGSISQAAGQKANLIMVNPNGIAFMNGSQVNLNTFTASTLNMQQRFLDNFLPQGESSPQFEGDLNGGASRGFIKVFEGARITAGSQGRVMLIAPTVVNKGTVTAPDGQVIAAAASKVYLRAAGKELNGLLIEVDSPAGLADFDTPNADVRDGQLDGQTVALTNAAEDKLGHVSNFGELSTPRGNVTMVGYAVNQEGIARATTSVVAGGSVFLLAQDTATGVSTPTPGSTRAGRVTLGANSVTEVLPETTDTATTQDGTAGTGLDRPSRVRVLGQDVRVMGEDGNGAPGAQIVATSGTVELLAVDNPNADFFNQATDIFVGGSATSNTAKLYVGKGVSIDVSGLKDVAVSPNRSVVEIDLRGDELKDSPLNQVGPLRGEKVFIDVDRALAESDAGKPTLVARDTLLGLKAQQQRTVAERSVAGGTVKMQSKGETVVESGVKVDLSGGNLKQLPGQVKTTLLTSNGQTVDASVARADVRYDGIATRYVIDYGRWNRKEVIDLGQSFRFAEADVIGQNAGTLETFGIGGLFAQPDIVGATTTGTRQRALGLAPRGARWVVGFDDTSVADKNKFDATGYTTQDYKLNQDVILARAAAALPAGFRAGDALPSHLKATLSVDTRLVDSGRVAELSVLSNQAVAVRDAIRTPSGGAITLTGADVNIAADLISQGGSVAATARNTAGRLADGVPAPQLTVADGVRIATHGNWVNDLPGMAGAGTAPVEIDGGRIALRAETISNGPGSFISRGQLTLGAGVELDADGGARLNPAGKLTGGDGGEITLAGFGIDGFDTASIHAYGTGGGGSLSLSANRIEIDGSSAPAPDLLALDSGVFGRGGFARTTLDALTRLEIAPGAQIAPRLVSRDLAASAATRASGANLAEFGALNVRDTRIREAIGLAFKARQDTAQTGDLVVGTGARITLDPGASLTLDGLNQTRIDGTLTAHGGTMTATSDRDLVLDARAVLDVSGIAQTYTDTRGLRQGTVRPGGAISLSAARVVAEAGSHIDVSGAAPVQLDEINETGGLGRTIGSAAGSLAVDALGTIRLDGSFAAAGGDESLRGGSFAASLGGKFEPPNPGQSLVPIDLRLGSQVAPGQADGESRIDAARLEAAGFDRIKLTSRDAIVLENGLDLGAGRTRPLRELTLDAAAILSAGGDAALRADTINVGNADAIRVPATAATTNTGTLTLDARQLNLIGKFDLAGMDRANLSGREGIRFTGTTIGTVRPAAELRTQADLAFHGATVAPSSFTLARILAPGRAVNFTAPTGAPVQPYSAQGSLAVEAQNITQAGNVWAPLGQLDFRATDTLVFTDGSLTSVAAAPGSLLPFGKVQNGRKWVVDLDPARVPNGQQAIDALDGKSIRTAGARVDQQAGARFDLAGGGDLQAYEFTVGPGGSRDILADANTYAILPGFSGGFAPADPQERFDRASGESVFLAGVPGLADGIYTLLPAHYALLPGAYAVKLGGSSLLPGQAFTRQDGIRVAPGYLTDSRAGAPRAGDWQGIQVLTREQVRARSEFALTRASDFFADAAFHLADAGLLSVAVSGAGANALRLDSIYNFSPASGGRGAQVDISAQKLVVTSGPVAGLDPDAVVLDATRLNMLGADSLLLGATRSRSGNTTTLDVGATAVTLANDAATALTGSEVMLAARDTLTLKAGSAIDAQGDAGDAGTYQAAGNGAFVRAASTRAGFSRTGSPDRSSGTLVGETGSLVQAADSITLDATADNAFTGTTAFRKNGAAVAGTLGMGATRVHFGAAPTGSEGIVLSQTELDALDLAGLALTSYSTFDFHGDVAVGKLDGNGKPVLNALSLQGAGLAGLNNAGQTAQLNAKTLTLANPDNAGTYTPSGAAGSGILDITADTLVLAEGDKRIGGFSQVNVTANELAGRGTGTLDVDAPLTLNVARFTGERGANQSIDTNGALVAAAHQADRALAPATALGAAWALKGTTVDFDSLAELGSGRFTLTATQGDVNLGANARVDVAGRSVRFFDVEQPSWGGTAEFVSETGSVNFNAGAQVDVSAAAGGDAGTLVVRAADSFNAAPGSVQGQTPPDSTGQRGGGARARVDIGTLADFSALNAALNAGGFDGERSLRVRSGNVSVATGDTVRAADIRIEADAGDLDVAGTLDASGEAGGRIALYAGNNLDLQSAAMLDVRASGAGEDGGTIELGSRDGTLNLDAGSQIEMAGGAGGQGGTLTLRALRDGNDVKVGTLASTITGADAVNLEAVKVYDNIATLNATGASSGNTLTLATINADNTAYAANHGAIKTRLGVDADPRFHLLTGVEVRAPGTLTLAQDWNLATSRAGGEAGVLTLRAAGNLNLNANLSDGFSHATPCTTGTCPPSGTSGTPASVLAGSSWAYRLVAGARAGAADPLATGNTGDVTLAAGKLVRTGTGDIDLAAGQDIRLADASAAIYSAGRLDGALAGFTAPFANLRASYTVDGGDVRLVAGRNITAKPSAQLFSQWLYRQGVIDPATGKYVQQPSWWVRFDQFRQGVGALGGGNLTVKAGQDVTDLSASLPTQARVAGTDPAQAVLHQTGGGALAIEAGGNVLGGSYLVGQGTLDVRAGDRIGAGTERINFNTPPVAPIVALGDAKATLRAGGDLTLGNIVNPHLLPQSAGNLVLPPFGQGLRNPRATLFSTYGADTALAARSLTGGVRLDNAPLSTTAFADILDDNLVSDQNDLVNGLLPARLSLLAFLGNVGVGTPASGSLTLSPSASGSLDLMAGGSIRLDANLALSDMDPGFIPDALRPVGTLRASASARPVVPSLLIDPFATLGNIHAATPVHSADRTPARVLAAGGDITGVNLPGQGKVLNVSKSVDIRAGRDIRDLTVFIQHSDATDISRIEAGRDFAYDSTSDRRDRSLIRVGGAGRLELVAGRDIDLGTSGGIVSRGNIDNANLPSVGADLNLVAGVGAAGIDYDEALVRLSDALRETPDEALLWQARWLAGDDTLDAGNAGAAVDAVRQLDAAQRRARVRDWQFVALRETGRDANRADSAFAGDFSRGYAALELLFPGIRERNTDGSFARYGGDINLFASRVKSESSGSLSFFAPGGDVIVGLPNTPAALVNVGSDVLGIVASGSGDVQGMARGDMLVNQSRILTVGGGDVLLWSSEGDIDAGKGKKTASAVPPPVVRVDAQGNITLEQQGAVTGSGIGALFVAGGRAGDVDLIAPKGTVNAGDAGIRAGNLNIAAQVVLGADNISVSGTSTGTPVADTSAVSATASGATTAGNDVSGSTAALAQNLAEAARAAEELKKAFKPTFISAEVIGYGE